MAYENPHLEKYRNDPRSISELIEIAKSPDEQISNEAIVCLHCKGTREVLEAARSLSHSEEASERIVASCILAQIGVPDRTFPSECFETLKMMLSREADEEVIATVTHSVGFLSHPETPMIVAPFAGHSNPDIRLGVTQGLIGLITAESIALLIQLSKDQSDDVRDWATFGIGTLGEQDSDEIRTALFQRVNDTHEDTKAEAIYGLALRKDPRALPLVLQALEADSVGTLAIESAGELGDPQLLPALTELREWWPDTESEERTLEEAITACSNSSEIPC